jgi:hypothetical protein
MWNLFSFTGPYAYPYFFFPTLGQWIRNGYGGYALYYIYRSYGEAYWSRAYQQRYNRVRKKPALKNVPGSVREILKKLDKAPVELIKKRLGTHRPSAVIDGNKIQPLFKSTLGAKPAISPSTSVKKLKTNKLRTKKVTVNPRIALRTSQPGTHKLSKRMLGSKNFRDWNPDRRWAMSKGLKISYSSKTNAVVLPELKLNSRRLTNSQRLALKGNRSRSSRGGSYRADGSSSSTGSGSATSATSSSSGSRSGSSGGNRSGVGTGAKTNDK